MVKTKMIQCPDCKVDLKPTRFHKVEVDVCPSCYGIWFDYGEINAICDSDTLDNIDSAFEGTYHPKPLEGFKAQAARSCPRDQFLLERYQFREDSGLLIDHCSECGGIWLDEGELEGYVGMLKELEAHPEPMPSGLKEEFRHLHKVEDKEVAEFARSHNFLNLLGTTLFFMMHPQARKEELDREAMEERQAAREEAQA